MAIGACRTMAIGFFLTMAIAGFFTVAIAGFALEHGLWVGRRRKKSGLFGEQKRTHHRAGDQHNDSDDNANNQPDGLFGLGFAFRFRFCCCCCCVCHKLPLNLGSSNSLVPGRV
jgi:hypothetical protein